MNTFSFLSLMFAMMAFILLPSSSTTETIPNELLEMLKMQLDDLKVKMAEQQQEITELKSQMHANPSSQSFNHERERRSINNDDLSFTKRKRSSSGTSSMRAPSYPSTCDELAAIGHSLDGFYLVKNPNTNKMETVFCYFAAPVTQDLIGNVDVKTKIVHFYVQRGTPFISGPAAVIPWEYDVLNEGNAMDLVSGIFIAPVDGIYHFEFSGVKDAGADHLYIHLQLNGVNIGWAFTKGGNLYETISLSASLHLKPGDKVNLFYNGGQLVDMGNPEYRSSHFTGWLAEEDLQ